MHLVRRFSTAVLGRDPKDPSAFQELEDAGVPIANDNCRYCPDPCDEGHEEYGRRFDVDMESIMRGTVKPYRRQVVISTGKSDWAREVTEESGSLAKYLSEVASKFGGKKKDKERTPTQSEPSTSSTTPPATSASPPTAAPTPDGVFSSQAASRLSVLNGSHRSISDDPSHPSVIVLPDYVVISNVEPSASGASALWSYALSQEVSIRAGTVAEQIEEPHGESHGFQTWTLPYNCLIMLCSHKKRDNRCHIAAGKLEGAFSSQLREAGWEVDTDIEDIPSCGFGPLEDVKGSESERAQEALRQLMSLEPDRPNTSADPTVAADEKRSSSAIPAQEQGQTQKQKQKKALIIKNSHIGGHKYAGNVIIYFPTGTAVWYGRVTTHEVASIIKNTLEGGKILPALLRGGQNISRPGCKALHDW